MKNVTMISRRSFLKAAMAASAVSALAFTGCGGSASSTVAASSTASSAAASAAAEGGQTFKVGIVNYVDHASLNQIVESVESRLDELGAEKGVTFDYADYYANAQADQSNLNQIGADLVGDGVDVIVAVATPTAATMLAAVEDTDIPVVYSAVTDPAAAGFDGEENITGTSDALNTEAIMNLITAVNPDIDTIGLLYDLSQDASTQAIADAKAFCDANGIKYIEKNGTTTAEVQMAAEALIAAGVKAVFTPTDNTVMTAELSIYETFTEAGVQHYTGADSFALNGAFVGYGVDYVQLGEATADMVAELLCEGKTTADLLGAEKGVTFDYADYYANAQADQSNLNQIGADLVGDGVDVIVAVATPTAATMLAAVEDTDIPVVYSAVTDPAAAGFDGEENITGTSDALNTEAIMNLITAVNPDIDTIGLLYDLSQDASTQAIADAKAFCDANGIKYIEKNGTTTAEVQMAAEALIAAGVKAVFTPTDNTVMTAELSIYETFTEAGVQHYTGADSFALNGAFVGYGVDYVQLGEATADMVAELLCEGKTTADLPYQTFDNGIVTINTETCEALGLDLDTVKEAFKSYCTEIVEVTTAENFS